MSNGSKKTGSLFWGVLLIGLGVLFLLDNLGIVYFDEIISDYWPLILVAIGLKIIISATKEKPNEEPKVEPTAEVQQAEVEKAK